MRPKIILRREDTGHMIDATGGRMFRLTNVSGLGEPTADISTSKYAGIDGSYLSSVFIEKRNIVLEFEFLPPYIERKRLFTYSVVETRKPIRVYYKTNNVDVYADGIVESFEVDNFSEAKTTGQISIICVNPFWLSNAMHTATTGGTTDAFHFPFAIDEAGVPLSEYSTGRQIIINNAGIETGLTITLNFIGDVTSPYIHNDVTGESVKINNSFSAGETVVITTGLANKRVLYTHDATTEDITYLLAENSTWLQVPHGTNYFTGSADKGGNHIETSISWQDTYLGV